MVAEARVIHKDTRTDDTGVGTLSSTVVEHTSPVPRFFVRYATDIPGRRILTDQIVRMHLNA